MHAEPVNLLEQQKALLIAVATGGPRIQDKQSEYAERRKRIRALLGEMGLEDPVPFGDLWQWYGRWSDGSLPTYQTRRQYINDILQPTIDSLASGKHPEKLSYLAAKPLESAAVGELEIFVSHSASDSDIAARLASLLRNALNLAPERIRCTSVDGYRLPAGADTNERLRIEVREAKVFLALLSRNSIAPTYVLFEMGARWGAGLYFAPLVAGGLSPVELKAPLSGFNVLDLSSRAQLFQLLQNVAEVLGRELVSAAAFEAELSELANVCRAPIFDPSKPPFSIIRASWGAPGSECDVAEVLRTQIRNGRIAAQAHGPSLAADDPAFGRAKRLLITYLVGNKEKTIVIPGGAAECIP